MYFFKVKIVFRGSDPDLVFLDQLFSDSWYYRRLDNNLESLCDISGLTKLPEKKIVLFVLRIKMCSKIS